MGIQFEALRIYTRNVPLTTSRLRKSAFVKDLRVADANTCLRFHVQAGNEVLSEPIYSAPFRIVHKSTAWRHKKRSLHSFDEIAPSGHESLSDGCIAKHREYDEEKAKSEHSTPERVFSTEDLSLEFQRDDSELSAVSLLCSLQSYKSES